MPPPSLIESLHSTLKSIAAHPCPHVTNPESTKKRASVALIVRIQPTYSHWPPPIDPSTSHPTDIDAFFNQDWVKNGQPEVLFIKRAARQGDRWTSHIALPGGRRDPEDLDDQAAAVRETIEEVGIDLSAPGNAIAVGSLPQRVVTTSWGRVPLMVLCPYIYLLTTPTLPPQRLQPTEVASTHWVPLPALLSPSNRTTTLQDISSRLAKNQETGFRRHFTRAILGKMEFSAIRLLPAESLYCTISPVATPSQTDIVSAVPPQHEQPLILWGLTLGILSDFLELMPPHTALRLWSYPTLTPWDLRFVIWVKTLGFRKRKMREFLAAEGLSDDDSANGSAGGVPSEDVGVEEAKEKEKKKEKPHSTRHLPRIPKSEISQPVFQPADDKISPSDPAQKTPRRPHVSSAVGRLLDGYYPLLRKAVILALIGRVSAVVGCIIYVLFWLRRRGRRNGGMSRG